MAYQPTQLDRSQLQRIAPSVFAEQAWSGVSDKYTFLPTSAVVDALAQEGLQPYQARQSFTRIEGFFRTKRILVLIEQHFPLAGHRLAADGKQQSVA